MYAERAKKYNEEKEKEEQRKEEERKRQAEIAARQPPPPAASPNPASPAAAGGRSRSESGGGGGGGGRGEPLFHVVPPKPQRLLHSEVNQWSRMKSRLNSFTEMLFEPVKVEVKMFNGIHLI